MKIVAIIFVVFITFIYANSENNESNNSLENNISIDELIIDDGSDVINNQDTEKPKK